MKVFFVEQPSALPAPPAEGRVAVVDVAFAGGDNFEKSTVPFLEQLLDFFVDSRSRCLTVLPALRDFIAQKRLALIHLKHHRTQLSHSPSGDHPSCQAGGFH